MLSVVAFALCFGHSTQAQRYTFHYYGQNDGLKNLATRCLLQDPKGFLWVCTESGLFRFDGSVFEKMPIDSREDPYITGITQDKAGRIWIAKNHTLSYYDALGAHAIKPPDEEFEFDLQASLAADPDNTGRLYFVSRHNLLMAQEDSKGAWQITPYFDLAETTQYPSLKAISFVYAQPHGQLWLGCGLGLCTVSNNKIRLYGKTNLLPEEHWRMAFVDRQQRVWVRGERSLFRFDAGTQKFLAAEAGLPPFSVGVRNPTMVEDHQGRILINLTEGIARLEGASWQVIREKTDLPPYTVTTLFSDRQGSIWLGLEGHGVARWLGYDEIENWTSENGLSSHVVWNFARDRHDRLWIGTELNLESMSPDGRQIRPQVDTLGHPMRRVQSVAIATDGHIWSGSDDGTVTDYDPETKRSREVAKLRGIFHIFSDHSDRIWVCSLSGLFYEDIGDKRAAGPHPVSSSGPHGQVYEGIQDKYGTLWFISDSGLYRLSGGIWNQIQLPIDYRPGISAQIAIAHNGTFWLSGSDPAIINFRVEGDKAQELGRVSAAALGSSDVYFVKVDRRGWLWIGTGEGLRVFNGQQWARFTAREGLVWNDINSDAFFEDVDGTIWIGTSGGMSHLLHPERLFHADPLSLVVRDVRIGEATLSLDRDVKVPWGRQPLTARFSALNFKRESSTNFRYRIKGVGEDWQDTAEHNLRYPPLPPGSYRLAVVAFDAFDGTQSDPVYVSFEISPPWWRTRSTYAAESAAAILLGLLLWRRSVRTLVARQHQLEGMVRQRTSELEKEKAELLKTKAALEDLATHDSLTGLWNRRASLDQLESQIARARREETSLALALVDIDHFKNINDSYGHLTGDCVLREYGRRLRSIARKYDSMGRYGGEELIMILPGFAAVDSDVRLAAIHDALCLETFLCNGNVLQVTCSLGVAWYQPGLDSSQSLIERADKALYAAKGRGRNRVEVG